MKPSSLLPISALFLLWLSLAPAHAVVITFDDYATGNLTGKPGGSGTSWTGPATLTILVEDGAGIGGSNAVVAQSGVSNGGYTFSPDAADLGAEFSAASSMLSFSMTLAWDAVNSSATGIGRVYIGSASGANSDAAFYLNWYSNGKIGFNSGGTFYYIKQSSGADFVATADLFYQLDVTLDYASKTFSLTFNDVTQALSGNEAFAFTSAAASTAKLDLLAINNANANFQKWTVDNLSYQAIPEPASLVWLAAGGIGALVAARRRK